MSFLRPVIGNLTEERQRFTSMRWDDGSAIGHNVLWWKSDDGLTHVFCAERWCDGRCGHPLLVLEVSLPDEGMVELRARNNATACGPFWQRRQHRWTGDVVRYARCESVPPRVAGQVTSVLDWWWM